MSASVDNDVSDDEKTKTSSDVENEDVEIEKRSVWDRVRCLNCDRWGDMLRMKANNRICDICNKGPFCFGCYKGDWLSPCICEKCAQTTPLPEISKLRISNDSYRPRFYKPNIQPLCSFCREAHGIVRCRDCRQYMCDECVGVCEVCDIDFCIDCSSWCETTCESCGNPEFDKEKYMNPGTDIAEWDSEDEYLHHDFML